MRKNCIAILHTVMMDFMLKLFYFSMYVIQILPPALRIFQKACCNFMRIEFLTEVANPDIFRQLYASGIRADLTPDQRKNSTFPGAGFGFWVLGLGFRV